MSDFFKDATICTFVLFLFLFKGTHYETSAFFPFKSALISTLHTTRHAVSKFVEFVSCAYGCLSAHTHLYPSTAGSSRSFSHANFDSGLSVFRAAAALAGSQVFT